MPPFPNATQRPLLYLTLFPVFSRHPQAPLSMLKFFQTCFSAWCSGLVLTSTCVSLLFPPMFVSSPRRHDPWVVVKRQLNVAAKSEQCWQCGAAQQCFYAVFWRSWLLFWQSWHTTAWQLFCKWHLAEQGHPYPKLGFSCRTRNEQMHSSDIDARDSTAGWCWWAGRLELKELVGHVVGLSFILDQEVTTARWCPNHHHCLTLRQLGLTSRFF